MTGKDFKDLLVWQKSMNFAAMIYENTKCLPKEELFCLSNQMRRAAVSIPSNIAEGQQRYSNREFIHFLHIAKGSLGELETQIILCEKLGYFSQEKMVPLLEQSKELSKMLNGLIDSIQ